MTQWMAASVCWCTVFCLVFFINSVFCCSIPELFHYRGAHKHQENNLYGFISSLSHPFCGITTHLVKAFTFVHAVKCTWHRLHTILLGLLLCNMRSLCNKLGEFQLLVGEYRDISTSFILYLMESWLCELIPDSALWLSGFQLFRVDRDADLIKQSERWEYMLLHCVGFLFWKLCINSKNLLLTPHASFIPVSVYFPPQAHMREAQRLPADQIPCVERRNPDSFVIILSDFNKGNLIHELPQCCQLTKCLTEENILDCCYTTINSTMLSRCPLRHTVSLWPSHGPLDSCIQADIKTLNLLCGHLWSGSYGGSSHMFAL